MNASEIEQHLERADGEQRRAMPAWRNLLADVFTRDSVRYSSAQRSAIIGAPGRRDLFRIGGVSLVGAALIAACGSDDEPSATAPGSASVDVTGGTEPSSSSSSSIATSSTGSSTTSSTGSSSTSSTGSSSTSSTPARVDSPPTDLDLALLRTATSLELTIVAMYQSAIYHAESLGVSAPVAEAAFLFQAHHSEHAAALQSGTEAAGGTPYDQANPFLMENVVTPALEALSDETSVVELALLLEVAASQTYTFAGGELSLPGLRQTIMSIGGVEARHAAVLRGVLGRPQVPNSFNPVTDAAPPESFISAA